MVFHHVPVLLRETMDALAVRPGGVYIDCTVGGGGHSAEILRLSSPDGRLIGFDQDDNALAAAGERLAPFGGRVRLVRTNFAEIAAVVDRLGIGPVDGVLMDIGVSSHQFDEGERGFSYHHDAPLDMRMDRTSPLSAAVVVNEWPEEEIARVIREYGEERWASRIAQFIARARSERPVETTGQLVEIIKAAIPAAARREGGHPARRTFQAIRIAVNDELGVLQRGLEGALQVLKPGGRLAVITFHSLEDRIVKQTFARWAKPCTCPPNIPVCVCGKRPLAEPVTRKPVKASAEELKDNPRSRSATLRAVAKLQGDEEAM
ncbi:16S rRNA (cytosine1402-N4)-methyltransferase [Symbiobacterium terraclitae]|uniref:Ribosomal RNA small subunit methyltransferase H n=1 Tax=Symbiobacterium terraclitae TaxID=557451 RepID=A0ABS4JNR1_9FIRM|nr:16S rRNA (cytosine1402-N4)-methyltransferase [Symbiobacterium terraclitae]